MDLVLVDTFGPMVNLNVGISIAEHGTEIQDNLLACHFLLCFLTSIIIDLVVVVPHYHLSSFSFCYLNLEGVLAHHHQLHVLQIHLQHIHQHHLELVRLNSLSVQYFSTFYRYPMLI